MLDWLFAATWSPYIAGAGIGILVWMTFLLSDRPLGVSTAYAKTAGMIEKALSPENAGSMPYYRQVTPTVDWQWTILAGVVIGGFALRSSRGRSPSSPFRPNFPRHSVRVPSSGSPWRLPGE